MNVLSAIFLIAAAAQLAVPGAQTPAAASGSSQVANDGWHLNADGTLSYIVNISPDEIAAIAEGNELALVIPPFVRPNVSQVIVRIGNTPPEREPPEAELQQMLNQSRQVPGPSLSLTPLDSRSEGRYFDIDSPPAGANPLRQVNQNQLGGPLSANPGASGFTAPGTPYSATAAAGNAFPNTQNPQPRNPAIYGRNPADAATSSPYGAPQSGNGFAASEVPSLFPQPQQPNYSSGSEFSATLPPGASQLPTVPINPPLRNGGDGFSSNPGYQPTQGAANGNTQQPYPSTGGLVNQGRNQNGFLNPPANPPFASNASSGYPFNEAQYTGTTPAYPSGQSYGGNPNYGRGPDAYVADNRPPSSSIGTSSQPLERTYTSAELRELTEERVRAAEKAIATQLSDDYRRQLATELDETTKKIEDEQERKATLIQVLLLASVVLNAYLFYLMKRLFERYKNLQTNTRNSMTLAT